MKNEKALNPRFLAYCRAMGTPDPKDRLRLDDERYPGGKMLGYVEWNRSQMVAFAKLNNIVPEHSQAVYGLVSLFIRTHQDEYDAWLNQTYP